MYIHHLTHGRNSGQRKKMIFLTDTDKKKCDTQVILFMLLNDKDWQYGVRLHVLIR